MKQVYTSIVRLVGIPSVTNWLVFFTGCLAFGIYSVQIGCDLSWDLKNYHYYNPYALLNGRIGLDYLPAQIQTFLNPFSFFPFYLAVSYLKPIQVGFIFGGLHGVSFGLLFLIGHRLFASLAQVPRFGIALVCAIMGVSGPIFLDQLGSSHNDNLIVPLVLLSLLLFLRYLQDHHTSSWHPGKKTLVITGLLMGLATGLKLVFLAWHIAFAVAVFFVVRTWTGKFMSTGFFALGSMVGLLVSRGYWMAFLWSKFGSPVFPFYNTIFGSPLYYDSDWFDHQFLPQTFAEAVKLPFIMSDGRIALTLLVILLTAMVLAGKAIMSRRNSQAIALNDVKKPGPEKLAAKFLMVFFLAAFAIWGTQFSIPRYAVPLELLAPMLIVVVVINNITHRKAGIVGVITVMLVAIVTLSIIHPRQSERTGWYDNYFKVSVPHFDNPEDIIVILGSGYPISYVIPFFQPEIRFVSLCDNFYNPGPANNSEPPQLVQEILKLLRSHDGELFLMAPFDPVEMERYGIGLAYSGDKTRGKPILSRPSSSKKHKQKSVDCIIMPAKIYPPSEPVLKHSRKSIDRRSSKSRPKPLK